MVLDGLDMSTIFVLYHRFYRWDKIDGRLIFRPTQFRAHDKLTYFERTHTRQTLYLVLNACISCWLRHRRMSMLTRTQMERNQMAYMLWMRLIADVSRLVSHFAPVTDPLMGNILFQTIQKIVVHFRWPNRDTMCAIFLRIANYYALRYLSLIGNCGRWNERQYECDNLS